MPKMTEARREHVRTLRREQTVSEAMLWEALRDRAVSGLKFRRQRVIGPYTVDFCCDAIRLVIEIDGSVHDDPGQIAYDRGRDAALTGEGYTVLRVKANAVEGDLPGVVARIRSIADGLKVTPSPLAGEGDGG